MNIIIDEDNFYVNSSKIIKGEIYFKIGKEYFPDEYWTDFVSVILEWWMYGFFDAVKYKKDFEFYLMDGPYKILGERKGDDEYILKYIETYSEEVVFTEYENIKVIGQELLNICKKVLFISTKKEFCFSNQQRLEKMYNELKKIVLY